MMHYFHRQVQLWGEDVQRLLQQKRIAIIGSGGLGSSLGFALGATGIGEIHIVDFDEVSGTISIGRLLSRSVTKEKTRQ